MHHKQEQLSLKWAHHYFFSKYDFLQERQPCLTGAPTQPSRSHKWSRLTASLMSSPMVLSHSVKSKVWIVKGPKGQCCITMTSTHKTSTRILPNNSWSANFMSHSASGLLSFMVQNIMDKKDATQLKRLRKTISQWTQSAFCCSSFIGMQPIFIFPAENISAPAISVQLPASRVEGGIFQWQFSTPDDFVLCPRLTSLCMQYTSCRRNVSPSVHNTYSRLSNKCWRHDLSVYVVISSIYKLDPELADILGLEKQNPTVHIVPYFFTICHVSATNFNVFYCKCM